METRLRCFNFNLYKFVSVSFSKPSLSQIRKFFSLLYVIMFQQVNLLSSFHLEASIKIVRIKFFPRYSFIFFSFFFERISMKRGKGRVTLYARVTSWHFNPNLNHKLTFYFAIKSDSKQTSFITAFRYKKCRERSTLNRLKSHLQVVYAFSTSSLESFLFYTIFHCTTPIPSITNSISNPRKYHSYFLSLSYLLFTLVTENSSITENWKQRERKKIILSCHFLLAKH